MLSVSECAQILGVSTARVRQLIASGSLEATKVGRSWVLPEVAVFEECKKAFSFCVSLDVLQSAKTQEEADFYMELSDFFLRQKQRELVKRGVF